MLALPSKTAVLDQSNNSAVSISKLGLLSTRNHVDSDHYKCRVSSLHWVLNTAQPLLWWVPCQLSLPGSTTAFSSPVSARHPPQSLASTKGNRTSEPQLSYLSKGNNNCLVEDVLRIRDSGAVPGAWGTHQQYSYCRVMVVVSYCPKTVPSPTA